MALEAAGLTQAMMSALASEWQAAHGSALPAAGLQDRRMLFAAVARGFLSYLEAHQGDVITSIQFIDSSGDTTTRRVNAVELNITAAG